MRLNFAREPSLVVNILNSAQQKSLLPLSKWTLILFWDSGSPIADVKIGLRANGTKYEILDYKRDFINEITKDL